MSTTTSAIRYLDVAPTGSLSEIFVRAGVTERAFVGQNGWERLEEPPPSLRLKTRLYERLGSAPWGPVYRACLETVDRNIRRIRKATAAVDAAAEDLQRVFAPASVGPRRKAMLAIDMVEECRAVEELRGLLDRYGYDAPAPFVLGEESLFDAALDLSHHDRLVILQDTLDGTDEVEQGTAHWCSSMIVYDPRADRIVAAFVGLPDRSIYFALDEFVGTCRFVGDDLSVAPELRLLTGPSRLATLDESVVSFYGHKPSRLAAMASDARYRALVARLGASTRARVRTHAGQPMMMRLADRAAYRQVDVVLELVGQAPHDVVAGLHIARLAGAHLCDLSGKSVDLTRPLRRPADPRSRLTYVLAASAAVAGEILDCWAAAGAVA